ncbi:MAG: flavodoxin family protein [Patescibacteria group bacterium]
MKAVLVYDSVFGNTRKIAEAIYSSLGRDAVMVKAWEFHPDVLERADLVVMGSPIQAWRPSKNMLEALKRLRPGDLTGKKVAAFDSRYDRRFAGTACFKIARRLTRYGGTLIAKPEHFIVLGHEGPLRQGEVERAASWGRMLIEATGKS